MVDYKIGVNWGLSRGIGEFFKAKEDISILFITRLRIRRHYKGYS